MTVTDQALRDPLEMFVGYQLRRTSAILMSYLGAELTKIGLRPTEATILMVIDANPGCTQSDIGRLLSVKRANMVPLIASLCDSNLIDRSRMDGRSHALHLSAGGEEMVIKVREAIGISEERFCRGLSAREADRLLDLFRKIRRYAGQDAGQD